MGKSIKTTDKLKCLSCGAILPKVAKFCVECGKPAININNTEFTENQPRESCPNGHGELQLWDGKLRCWKCGWPLPEDDAPVTFKRAARIIDNIGEIVVIWVGMVVVVHICRGWDMSLFLSILVGIGYALFTSMIWGAIPTLSKSKYLRPTIVILLAILAIYTNPSEAQHKAKILSTTQQSVQADMDLLSAVIDSKFNVTGQLMNTLTKTTYYNMYLFSFTTLEGFGLRGLMSIGFMKQVFIIG